MKRFFTLSLKSKLMKKTYTYLFLALITFAAKAQMISTMLPLDQTAIQISLLQQKS